MKRDVPFLAHQVHYELVTPNVVIEHVETDEKGFEHVVEYSEKEFEKKFPLSTGEISLQQILDAGVSINEVPTNLYESTNEGDLPSQSELLNRAESIVDRMNEQSNEQFNKE